jgi:hypothetical protein
MEIYLLREQKEVGPYAAEDVRSWLDTGDVSASELAWAPGLESWVPLQTILEPPLAPEPELESAPEPVAEPVAAKRILKPLPRASAPQKAFLSYMGVSFPPEITAEEAERLTREVSEDTSLAARKSRWEDDRLDLHPELFAEELKERRANRPGYFHKLVQTEGGDCFTGVTKAHCQVLVGYLDVNHPHWDANLRDATWHYFFPAIAEKFPQLVHKEWRPKLKFKEGPKVAAELLEPKDPVLSAAEKARRGRIISRGVTLVVLLGLAGAGFGAWRSSSISAAIKARASSFGTQVMTVVRGDDPALTNAHPIPPKVASSDAAEPSPVSPDAPKIASTTETATPASDPKPPEAKPEAKPEMKEGMAPAADATAPVAQMKPTEGLFDPKANTPAAVPTAPPLAGLPGLPGLAGPSKTEARLTQPVQIPTKFGVVTINPGTLLRIISREGNWITLNHMGQAIRVPVSSTDAQ